jgi:threonine dehydratase
MANIPEITRERIAATETVIRPYVRRTPVLNVDLADFGLASVPVTFKLEMLQHSGAFKVRGAFANLLLRKVPRAGVAAASGGNHGAAVAYAAQRLGLSATIFLPDITSPAKAERIRDYGAKLRIVGTHIADALVACDRFVAETGAMSVHPFDQAETMLGQGSVGMELEQDANLDSLLVAVGGGGLIGSLAAWFGGKVRIIGVEPELAPTLHSALAAGRPVDAPAGGIAADALGPPRVGQLMFPIARAHVSEVLLVGEDDIRRAQVALWQTLRVVAEPGGATAFAALLSHRYRPSPGERVGLIISGANTTAVNFES